MKKTNDLQLNKLCPPERSSIKKALLSVFLMLFLSVSAFAQQSISGTVYDSDGAPLPGASVVVKGTTTGTQTDFDGKYTISAASDATLVFSYVGFATQEIPVNGQSTIDVTLAEAENQLSEVVVTGYSTQTRGDITGSVASVDISEAVKLPVTNAAEVLEGRVTGVTVINNGNPGAAPQINIRGFGTSNNTNPLFIIDGVQTDNPSILNSINPNDIAQMNVLKDGAAAIYGARASNGVVIVTTKSGSYNQQGAKISFDAFTGFSKAVDLPELLSAQQHGEMIFESLRNDGATVTHPQYGSGATPVVPGTLNGVPVSATVAPGGTNWLDAILQNALTQNVSMSLSNGNETGKYFMSAGFVNREGVQITTGFKQVNTQVNSEFKIGDYVTIGQHLNGSFSNTVDGNQINGALRSSPLIPVRDDDGALAGTYAAAAGLGNARSPVAQLLRGKDNFNKLFRVFGDVYLSAKIMEELTFKTNFSGNIESRNVRRFQALDPEHSEPLATNTLFEQNFSNFNWTWTNTLNFNKNFGEHSLNALIGIEAVEDGSKGNGVSRSGYIFETPEFYLLSNGTGTPNVDFAFDGATSLFSIFGTANYSYGGKYFATATLRRDETSRFSGENKSDVFPSFSGGWLVSGEDFFPQDSFISRLKVKASYGELGNQSLPVGNPTFNISLLSETLANYSFDGSSISTGVILNQVGNPDLRWETSVTTNVGFEMGFLSDKLSLGLEFFNIETKDLITRDFSQISTTAIDASAPLVNLGSVKNTGFDLAIGYNDQTDSGFSYGVQLNLSRYKNEVTELISDFQVGNSGFRGGAITRTEVGQPISFFYGREVTGFDGNGRFTYRDVNNDGNINDDDRTFIGSPHPDFTYGLNLNAAFKGFDISAFFTGSQGNDIYNYEKIFTDFPTFFNGNRSARVLDSWTPTNTNATLPALSQTITNSETQPNSYFVEDGSFFRLKNLQIGYTLPSSIVEKAGFDSLRFFIQGTNLFTITDYQGLNPEIATGDNLTLGVDSNIYPNAQILTLGVNLKL
ncbi:TonB-dependent receptor [Spongiivirga sp. MCCC 1A20706]|uniref:SusC/RagA family TonB-linked outer membrane protein n=1 Tax=Spongiivirga sp. MCCC 1A20706 TaxID=3160963 RepID=UPI0039778A03